MNRNLTDLWRNESQANSQNLINHQESENQSAMKVTNSVPPPTVSPVRKKNGARHIKTSSFHHHAGYQSKLFVVA